MGEVYRARDTRLDRDVAIKILPELFAADHERLARFEREAKTLASLNHPNIAAIHGIEETGTGRALVMELVEGENLAQRIARGPIPLDEALAITRRMAEALEAAHEKGVIHRDLKPANVMIAGDADVKVLDFGLAKAGDVAGASSLDVINSPTITSPATQIGTILGTAAYMSPEQAKGRAADRRWDVWALGCVLFEMLSGRRAFDGEDISDTLALVLRGDPDWTALRASTPPVVISVIRQCLTKDRKGRIPYASVVRFLLDAASAAVPVAPTPRAIRGGGYARLVAALVAGAVITAAAGWRFIDRTDPARVQFDFPLRSATTALPAVGVSPNGRMVAYTGSRAPGLPSVIFVRHLDGLQSRALDGTEGAGNLFWSPDSRSIGFIARGRLQKIAVDGGQAQELASVTGGVGGSWNEQGDIIYSSGGLTGASLHRVPAAGGVGAELLKPDGRVHLALRYPVFGGRRFLYLAWSADPSKRAIFAGSLDGEAPVMVTPAESQPVYARPGYLLYHRVGTVFAQRFDASSLRLSGEAFRLADGARFSTISGRAAFAASSADVLAIGSGISRLADRTLSWVGRDGRPLGTVGEPGAYDQVRLSPDETRAAVAVPDPRSSLMTLAVVDLATGISTPLPLTAGGNDPVWSPDSKTLMFETLNNGKRDFFTHDVGSRGTELMYESPEDPKWLDDWSRDGRYVLFHRPQPAKLYALDTTVARGVRAPFALLEHGGNLDGAHFSPDRKWIAHVSDESGAHEVWVASFPAFDQRRRVSLKGGGQPFWRGDGRELFYLSPDGKMMSAAVEIDRTSGRIVTRTPTLLFQSPLTTAAPGLDQYSVTKDGQRFLFITPGKSRDETPHAITVILNWATGLR